MDALKKRLAAIRERLAELKGFAETRSLTDEENTEVDALLDEFEEKRGELTKLEQREQRMAQVRDAVIDPERTDDQAPEEKREKRDRRTVSRTPEDIYDLAAYRSAARDGEDYRALLIDGARRSIEEARFPHEDVVREEAQEHLERLIDTVETKDGALSRHLLVTGSERYRKAFGKAIAGAHLNEEERTLIAEAYEETRALSVGTGSAGGFAVPYQLDPTVIPTSNGSVNPLRAIARKETIVGTNEWRGISSAGITAGYAAEAAESSDNAPTLAQPTLDVERAHAFVPFSIELGGDWGSLQSEMAKMLAIAKDDLEADKFFTGAGHGSTEPKGLITAATNTVTATGVASFAVSDMYKLEEAVPARFRARAAIIGNKFAYNNVRQFDTSGGASLWRQLGQGAGSELLGYPAYESTAMASALTTGSKILAMGDPNYFLIVDRLGMTVEVLPHLLGANRRPTGQRGIYAYWRNTSDLLSAAAWRVLVTG